MATHVFPAVEMAQIANFSLNNGIQGIAGALAKHKLLNVCGLNLAAMVDNIAIGVNDDLGNVKTAALNLRVAQRDINLGLAGSTSNAVHLFGIWTKRVFEVILEKGQRILVVNTPSPVGVSMMDYQLVSNYYAP